jgi:peptidoglycan-N-acetylglucosamine deacetylase
MNQQVFYDPQRKRWKRLRRIFDLLALLGLVLGSVFVVGLMRMKPLPELFLKAQKRNYRALANQSAAAFKFGAPQNGYKAGRRPPELG